jgi:hypothetical protein
MRRFVTAAVAAIVTTAALALSSTAAQAAVTIQTYYDC